MTDQTPDTTTPEENNGKPAPRAERGYCLKCGATPTHAELLPRNDGAAVHLPTHALRAVGGGGAPMCGPVVTHWHYLVAFVDQGGRPGRTFLRLNFEIAGADHVEAIEKKVGGDLPKRVAVDPKSGAPIVGLDATDNRAYVTGYTLMRRESGDLWLRGA